LPLPDAIEALRYGVAFGARVPVGLTRIRGPQAFEWVDAVCPRPLFLRDGQALQTLFLNDDGTVFADVTVCCDDLDYVLLFEGPSREAMGRWLTDHAPPGLDAAQVDESATHEVIGLDGPYSWEWLGRLVGPDVIGVPYLGLFFVPEHRAWALRAGKTGEYGYDVVVPKADADGLRERLGALGRPFGVRDASVDDLDLCALENGIFSIRAPGATTLSPVALQLSWRLDPRRTFPGVDALRRARQAQTHRITRFRGPTGGLVPAPGEPVALGDAFVGEVLEARGSYALDAPVGLLRLDVAVAHPGLDVTVGGRPGFRTVSSPLLHNRSLFLDAQRHAFATRATDRFPPLAPAPR
jgi:glycine cleavage system aminomethyltransferase T